MAESENEVVGIVGRCGLLKGQELEKLANAARNVQRKRLKDNEKCKRLFRVLSDWMTVREHGQSICDYLKARNATDLQHLQSMRKMLSDIHSITLN